MGGQTMLRKTTPFLIVSFLVAGGVSSMAQLPNPCDIQVLSPAALSGPILVCPQGDGDPFSAKGGPLVIRVVDLSQVPLPNIPASDYWLKGCTGGVSLCGGHNSINADAPSDANGTTTISGAWRAGGCDIGIHIVAQFITAGDPNDCSQDLCMQVRVVSPDFNGDGVIDIVDFAAFGPHFLHIC